jgi:hypothetical protein
MRTWTRKQNSTSVLAFVLILLPLLSGTGAIAADWSPYQLIWKRSNVSKPILVRDVVSGINRSGNCNALRLREHWSAWAKPMATYMSIGTNVHSYLSYRLRIPSCDESGRFRVEIQIRNDHPSAKTEYSALFRIDGGSRPGQAFRYFAKWQTLDPGEVNTHVFYDVPASSAAVNALGLFNVRVDGKPDENYPRFFSQGTSEVNSLR